MTKSKSWMEDLPPFVSISTIAEMFDVQPITVRRWTRNPENNLPTTELPNGRKVCAREHVIALANKLYGELETQHERAVPGSEPGRSGGDDLDRPRNLRSAE